MADFNALTALINAYIKQNGVKAITGQILNGVLRGMVSALGKGYTVAGEASPTTDPGTMTGPVAYIAHTAGTYEHFGNLVVAQGEVAMLIYDEAVWRKDVLLSLSANATVDANVGTPEVTCTFVDGVLTFDFRNMKGNPGDAAGFGAVTATVDANVGTPGVSVQTSGPDTAKNITFAFRNLKGETGVTSCVVTVDNTTGTPSCAVSLVGQELHLDFSGLKGAQGNTGSSVDYPFEIVNNLTTNDATKALSAAMGVQLESEVSQLEAEVTDLDNCFDYVATPGSANLLDLSTMEVGVYYKNNGMRVENSSDYSCSAPIPVTPGDVLTIQYGLNGATDAANRRSTNYRFVCAYDANMSVIAGGASAAGTSFTVPENCAFVRISAWTDSFSPETKPCIFANQSTIVDYEEYSLPSTKKVLKTSALPDISATIPDGAVTSAKVADGAIGTSKIADGAVSTAKMADGAVASAKIASGAVITEKIADGVVTMAKIAPGAIEDTRIAEGAVTIDKTDFFVMTDNLFDKSSSKAENGYLSAGGIISPSDSYKTSGYIPVEAGATYYFNASDKSTIQPRFVYWFDANLCVTGSITSYSASGVAPAGTAFLRLTYGTTDWEYGQVTKGSQKAYVSYGKINPDYYVPSTTPDEIPVPEIVMPSVVYAYDSDENSVYHKNYASQINFPYFINSGADNWKYFERYFRNSNGASGNLSIVLKKFTANGLETVSTKSIPTALGLAATNNGAKKVNCIGDSFTYNGTWFNYVNTLCPSLSFVGMRKCANAGDSLRAEGRGGWRLATYFEPHADVTASHLQPFSPFVHPAGYKYYGVLEFWKAIVNENSQYPYGTDGFDDYKSWFDANGYKKNPSTNDLMYDGTNDKYIYYNGTAWVDYSGTPDFVFDYAKYIQVWNIASPDYVIVMLGVNDWIGGVTEEAKTVWNTRMQTLIQSVQSYATSVSKTIKIGICTNTTAPGSENNSLYRNPLEYHLNLFNGRKNTIETFDTSAYKANNVFVIDSGVCLDPDYGFGFSSIKPFTFYAGSERELYDFNGVHPSDEAYKQLGVCVAGFVQYTR